MIFNLYSKSSNSNLKMENNKNEEEFKKKIAPFRWNSFSNKYILSLNADMINYECFIQNNMLGNGYDWENVAETFIEQHKNKFNLDREKIDFDSEADNFVMLSSSEQGMKEFALAFHEFVMNKETFNQFLSQLKEQN